MNINASAQATMRDRPEKARSMWTVNLRAVKWIASAKNWRTCSKKLTVYEAIKRNWNTAQKTYPSTLFYGDFIFTLIPNLLPRWRAVLQ